MKRVKLIIAYDGTLFHGYQRQEGFRTVEGELSRALTLTTGEEIELTGLSRTDAGVHALGNEVTFDTESTIPAERFQLAALKYLPEDLRIVSGSEVPADFDIRKQDVIKTYCYRLYSAKIENPLLRHFYAFSSQVPDIDRMKEAAKYLVGEHDFTSFANPDSYVFSHGLTPVRTLTDVSIDINKGIGGMEGALAVHVNVSGTGFLYNMVRIIAGTLFEVGYGRIEPGEIANILEARDRSKAGPTAEARGLTLIGARYIKNN